MQYSNYDLKFILPVLALLQRGEDGSLSCNIIPKSSEKLLLLELKWKRNENNNMNLKKNYINI